MKKKFESPELIIVFFQNDDIITDSDVIIGTVEEGEGDDQSYKTTIKLKGAILLHLFVLF